MAGNDWQVGDLAVCVDDANSKGHLRAGATYRVEQLTGPNRWRCGNDGYGIVVVGSRPFCSHRFRKICESQVQA